MSEYYDAKNGGMILVRGSKYEHYWDRERFLVYNDVSYIWRYQREIPPLYNMMTLFKNIGSYPVYFYNPFYMVKKDYLPDEFYWFFVKDIHVAVQETNYSSPYKMTHEKFIDTTIQAMNQPLLGMRLGDTFKGIYSTKNSENYHVNYKGEDYVINGLDKSGSMTTQTYRNIPPTRRDNSMIGFPSRTSTRDDGLGMFRGLGNSPLTRGIWYTQPFEAIILGGWGGDFDGNIPLAKGGNLVTNVSGISALYVDGKKEENYFSGYNNTPRIDLRDVRRLNTLFNYTYPKIDNEEMSGNEEQDFLLLNEEYEKQLFKNQTYSMLLEFATLTGGFLFPGFWMRTLMSLGEYAIGITSEEKRKADTLKNFDDSKIPHLERSGTTSYKSTFRNVISFSYEKEISTPTQYVKGDMLQNKSPYITIPVNELVKSVDDLKVIIKDLQDKLDMRASSFTINVRPYMNSDYGSIIDKWSKYLFGSGLDVNMFKLKNPDY